jgi:hypothetical protein
VLADKLWGAQTQRSLEHFSIGQDLIPREMITAYAILKKPAANAHHAGKRLDEKCHQLIVQVCDEILAGQHHDMFPLHVWMTGSGTQFDAMDHDLTLMAGSTEARLRNPGGVRSCCGPCKNGEAVRGRCGLAVVTEFYKPKTGKLKCALALCRADDRAYRARLISEAQRFIQHRA